MKRVSILTKFKSFGLACGAVAALSLAGCATSKNISMYHWDGSYEASIYKYTSQEGDVIEQIGAIEKSLEKARQNNKKVAPGLYSHLALLYSNIGDMTKFNEYLDKEVQAYPESAAFVTFLKSDKSRTKASQQTVAQ